MKMDVKCKVIVNCSSPWWRKQNPFALWRGSLSSDKSECNFLGEYRSITNGKI